MKNGWQKTTLGSVFATVTGNTPPKNDSNLYGQFMPLVKPPELRDSIVDSAADGLSKAGAANARTAPQKTILVSCIGNLGKVGLNVVPVAFNQQINAILPNESKTIPEFMFYQALSGSFKEQLEALASGTTVSIVNKSKFNSIEIVLPPLPEQQRIVGILDEAFAGIATAKANAEKNLQNARAVFESHLQSVFSQRGEGWIEKRLMDACVLQRGLDLPTRSRLAGDYPLVSSSGIIDTHNEARVKGPGVATGRSGSIGNVFYVEDDFWPLNTVLYVKEFYGNNPRFIYRLLTHFDLKRFASGAGVPTLNRNFIHDELVVIPESTEAQTLIASQLDALEAETKRLESIYQRKLAALEALKKSLLNEAFTGDL